MPIRLIAGLRNPGAQYEKTRHNAGAWLVEQLATAFKSDKKLQSEIATLHYNESSCLAALPLVFMNLNGNSIRAISQFYRIPPEEILVVHDELDLPAGRIKLKTGGGHGGHNGLRDTITQLGSAHFHRLRIGIGHPGDKTLVTSYVLGKPTPGEYTLILNAIERGIECIPQIVGGDLSNAMSQLNAIE